MDFIFDPSLVLYLPLHELDGAAIRDKSAYGHLGTVTGALWRPNGYEFDGIDDYIDYGNGASLNLTTAGTLMVWIKPTGTTTDYRVFISKGNLDTTKNGYIFDTTATLAMLELWLGSAEATQRVPITINAAVDTWYFLAATWDSSWINISSNGVALTAPVAQTVVPVSNVTNLYLGKDPVYAPSKFKGSIGEVFILNQALSPQEIQHNYLATKWRYQ